MWLCMYPVTNVVVIVDFVDLVFVNQKMNYNYIILNLLMLHYLIWLYYIVLHYITSYIYFTTYLQYI